MAGDGPDARAFERINAMVGATVIGRRTFDLGLRPWGGTPWPGVPGFVVTHRTREDLVGDNGGTFVFAGRTRRGNRYPPALSRPARRWVSSATTRCHAGDASEIRETTSLR